MCPQILRADKFSAKCDVWSVGVLFYEMIYGRTPFNGKTKE
jgi:serine/threonine protein kinase